MLTLGRLSRKRLGINLLAQLKQRDSGHFFLLVFFKFEACLAVLVISSVDIKSMAYAYTRQMARKSLEIDLLFFHEAVPRTVDR